MEVPIAKVMNFVRTDSCKIRKEITIIHLVKGGQKNSRNELELYLYVLSLLGSKLSTILEIHGM